ncbi:MAG: hypothetical protein REH83_04030 [Rickettsiella sp.]|nr:hypothetical protein [Rickettsiella sp.]
MSQTLVQRNLDTPGARLKYLRSILQLTRAHIEKEYKLPEITLKSWENGTNKLTENGLKRCIAVYQSAGLIVDENWIISGEGLDPTVRRSLEHYFSMPSDVKLPVEEDEDLAILNEVDKFRNLYDGAVAMLVTNDEMSPYYEPGSYVGGILNKEASDWEKLVGKDCIVFLKDGGKFFRRFYQDSLGRYNIACVNPTTEAAQPVIYVPDIDGVAQAIWIRKRDVIRGSKKRM